MWTVWQVVIFKVLDFLVGIRVWFIWYCSTHLGIYMRAVHKETKLFLNLFFVLLTT